MDHQVHEEPEGQANDDPTQPNVLLPGPKYPSAQAQNMNDDHKDDDVDATYDFIMQPRATSNSILEDPPTSNHDDQDSEDTEDDVPVVCKVFLHKRKHEHRSKKRNDNNS
ncbi:hypothetical protein ACH5RR_002544 [Cinchona calisaya]|uniref:Uncharacterized protein n=1 Tax=Cinchona calisaya TaxID=153742 RepID=A0ABD3ASA2_9GENT